MAKRRRVFLSDNSHVSATQVLEDLRRRAEFQSTADAFSLRGRRSTSFIARDSSLEDYDEDDEELKQSDGNNQHRSLKMLFGPTSPKAKSPKSPHSPNSPLDRRRTTNVTFGFESHKEEDEEDDSSSNEYVVHNHLILCVPGLIRYFYRTQLMAMKKCGRRSILHQTSMTL